MKNPAPVTKIDAADSSASVPFNAGCPDWLVSLTREETGCMSRERRELIITAEQYTGGAGESPPADLGAVLKKFGCALHLRASDPG